MDSMNSIFGIVGLFSGFYALRSWFQLKKTGDIKKSVFYPSNSPVIKRCKDEEGYIKETLPKLLIIGILAEFYGATELYNAIVAPIGGILVASMILLGVALIWVMIVTKKMNEKYF